MLYLHKGDPSTAADFYESAEGHALRFDAAGELVGVTIIDPRWLLGRDGRITITLPIPERIDVDAAALDTLLVAA